MITFILIPGALHPAWMWHLVIPLLERAGCKAQTSDLPGIGENTGIAPGDATLAIWADHVVHMIENAEQPVILVGHSRGGLIIGEAAERMSDRVTGLIYVTALIVPPGMTAIEVMADEGAVRPLLTEDGKAFWLPPEVTIPLFYNRCTPQDANEAAGRLTPEALAPITTPTSVSWDRWGSLPRAYIECTHDRTLDLDRQRRIQAAAPCSPVITIEADHSPFLSAPHALSRALLEAGLQFAKLAS